MSSIILLIITIALAIWLASTHYTNTHNKRYTTVRLSKDSVLKHNKLISLSKLPHEWITLIILIIQTSMSVLILLSISSDMKIESSIFSSGMLLILDVVIMCIIPTLVLFTLLDVSNMAYNLSNSSDTEHFESAPSNSLVLAHGVCLMLVVLAISMDMMLNSITITQILRNLPGYKQLIEWIEPSVPGFKHYLDANLLLDYTVINDDRHLNNLGLLRDTITGKFAVAPIFDTGNSLFCHKYIDNIQYEPTLPSVLQAKPFNPNFDTQLKLTDTSILKPNKNIGRYINTLLRNLEAQGLPKYRSEFIHDLLKDRLSSIGVFK